MRGVVYRWLRQALLSQRSFIFHNAVKSWQAADCNRMAPAFWCNVWYSLLTCERAFCLYLVKRGESSSGKGVGASTQPDTFNLHQLCLQWGKHFLKEGVSNSSGCLSMLLIFFCPATGLQPLTSEGQGEFCCQRVLSANSGAGLWLDSILEVFSTLNNSRILTAARESSSQCP